jgi:hypothetical protein
LLVETIYVHKFKARNTNQEKITHYLRNIIAFHVFTIYQTCGLRVQIPNDLAVQQKAFSRLLNDDFLTCGFLKKELPNGEHTSTNVPFILTIICLMIKEKTIEVCSKGKEEKLEKLFNAREGYIKSIEKEMSGLKIDYSKENQDKMWYMRHLEIGFKMRKGLTASDDKVMDLEELFLFIVYGGHPFVKPIAGRMDGPEDEKLQKESHYNVIHDVMKWLKKETIIETLKMHEPTAEKKNKKEEEPVAGWLAPSELKVLKQIINHVEMDDDEKKARLHEVMLEMQQTHIARALNIGMHMALWTPRTNLTEKTDGDPFILLEPVEEKHLKYLKKPPPKKEGGPTPFPSALLSVHSEVASLSGRLINLCKYDNCGNTTDTAGEFEKLYSPIAKPNIRRYTEQRMRKKGEGTGIKSGEIYAIGIGEENQQFPVEDQIPRKGGRWMELNMEDSMMTTPSSVRLTPPRSSSDFRQGRNNSINSDEEFSESDYAPLSKTIGKKRKKKKQIGIAGQAKAGGTNSDEGSRKKKAKPDEKKEGEQGKKDTEKTMDETHHPKGPLEAEEAAAEDDSQNAGFSQLAEITDRGDPAEDDSQNAGETEAEDTPKAAEEDDTKNAGETPKKEITDKGDPLEAGDNDDEEDSPKKLENEDKEESEKGVPQSSPETPKKMDENKPEGKAATTPIDSMLADAAANKADKDKQAKASEAEDTPKAAAEDDSQNAGGTPLTEAGANDDEEDSPKKLVFETPKKMDENKPEGETAMTPIDSMLADAAANKAEKDKQAKAKLKSKKTNKRKEVPPRTMATRSSPEEQPKKKMSKGKSEEEQMMNTGAALLNSDEDEDDEDEN